MDHCRMASKKECDAPFLNILFVDDDTRYLQMMKIFIENCQIKKELVSYAESAQQALAEIKKKSFDLIFTDFIMGDMNGIELARKVRELKSGVPIIMITGSQISEETASQANEAGISAIIGKPIKLYVLKEIIEEEQKKKNDSSRQEEAISVTLST